MREEVAESQISADSRSSKEMQRSRALLASQEPAGAPYAAKEAEKSEATGRGTREARCALGQSFTREWTEFRGRLLMVEQLAQYFGGCAAGAAAAKNVTEEERWGRRQLDGEVPTASPSSVAPQLASVAAASSCGRLKVVQCTSCSMLRRPRRPLKEARRKGMALMASYGTMFTGVAEEWRGEGWHLYSWCEYCKSMKPVWGKLMAEFKDSVDRLVADVDCISTGEEMSEQVVVEGFSIARYGDPHDLQDHDDGREFESQQKFVQLGSQRGPAHRELYEEKKKTLRGIGP